MNSNSDSTFAARVREMWPGASDNELDDVLWSATSFPFGTTQEVLSQLKLSHALSGGDVEKAIDNAHREIEDAMDEYRRLYPVKENNNG